HLIALRAYDMANAESIYKYFNKIVNFQPRYSINTHLRKTSSTRNIIERIVRSAPEWIQLSLASLLSKKSKYNKFSYSDYIDSMRNDSDVWNNKPVYQVVFPDWDNAPRYKERATFFSNTSIDNFGKALELVKTKVDNHDDKLVFINAWNEWSEGAYLEPDNKNEFAYLETIKKTFR
ncbi:glycoside hydrolase family 99-like domain-containing protein, partial [Hafnia alvei]